MEKILGHVIGLVIRQQGKYWKLYVIEGKLNDGEDVYRTNTGTLNIKVVKDQEDVLTTIHVGSIVKFSIVDEYTTGTNYGRRHNGTGYEVQVEAVVHNTLTIDG